MKRKTPQILDQYGEVLNITSQSNVYQNSVRSGGVINPLSGAGGSLDKGDATTFIPTILINRIQLETVYCESWVAARFIDMPVDDMFIKWREWIGEPDDVAVEQMQTVERELKCRQRLSMAMKAGRLHGTAFAVMFTIDASMDTPLEIGNIKEGDFKSIQVFDRYDMTVKTWVTDIYSPRYGQPEIYTLQPRRTHTQFEIHATRVLRFDGKKSFNSDGWSANYNWDYGVSELIPAMREILHDAGLISSVSHLVQEASIPVIKVNGFKESVSGDYLPVDEVSIDQLGAKISLDKSIYRTVFLDKEDEFDRINVNFAGLHDLIDQSSIRLAAIAGIPATRFLSRSPGGLNATGDSDAKNYALEVASKQDKLLAEPLLILDEILSRHAGLGGVVPDYEWRMLTDISQKEQADIAKVRAEAFAILLNTQAFDEDEIREGISNLNDPVLGLYPGSIDDFAGHSDRTEIVDPFAMPEKGNEKGDS